MYALEVADIDDWPDKLNVATPHFVFFLAMDATAVDSMRIGAFATKLIAQGMVYLCAWGPDCSRVHDVFDEVEVGEEVYGGRPSSESAYLMTSWHDGDEFDDALWFALVCTLPAPDYVRTCGALVAVAVGRRDWSERIEAAMANADRFIELLDRSGK